MSAAGTAAANAASAAAGNARSFFSQAWTAVKSMFTSAGHAAANATKGAGSGIKAADQYLSSRIGDAGVWGAVKGISKDHPVYTTLAGTGLAAGTVYAGSRIIGNHTRRVEQERQRSSEVER